MSSSLIQIFAFMACTFMLGLFLGWAIWRYDGISKKAIDSLKTEVEFWRGSLENNRNELWNEQKELAALKEEAVVLRKRLAASEA